ncbi:LuxR C-terminal-related transcriptional regulator [Streptomyces massasporeus]|uniref:LuxR C-terminal-related transcriptional regulator n=1 Tax=Streptomyces massasporeus TaxID=67324 RepID=UPI0033F77AB6
MITVVVVDDDRMLLDGLRAWLDKVTGVRLAEAACTVDGLFVAAAAAQSRTAAAAAQAGSAAAQAGSAAPEAATVTAGSAVARRVLPYDVVLLDLLLGDGSRPERNIGRLLSAGTRVLIISNAPDRRRIVDAVAAGADGYLTKDHDLPDLVAAIREVAAGGTAHSAELAFSWAHDDGPARPNLSPKGRQVLLEYASGLTLKATARRTGVSPHTAKYYLDRVKEKYRQAGRPTYTKIDLAARVREDGWTAFPDNRGGGERGGSP